MIGPLVDGVLLGLGAAAPVGPVNVEIARRTLAHGMRRGMALGFGAVTVDGFYALLVGLGWRGVAGQTAIRLPLGIAGALLLAYLGWGCLRSGLKRLDRLRHAAGTAEANPSSIDPPAAAEGSPVDGPTTPDIAPGVRGAYVTGVLMTLLNPMTLAWWFVVVPSRVAQSQGGTGAFSFTVVGVLLGAAAWVIFFSGLISRVPLPSRPRAMAVADLAGAVLLLGFALLAVVGLATGG